MALLGVIAWFMDVSFEPSHFYFARFAILITEFLYFYLPLNPLFLILVGGLILKHDRIIIKILTLFNYNTIGHIQTNLIRFQFPYFYFKSIFIQLQNIILTFVD